jgi:hypothetical protein
MARPVLRTDGVGRAGTAGFFRAAFLLLAVAAGGASAALRGACGPFTDVAADAFCPFVLEIFYAGITTGTTPTTFDPTSPVTRLQMAAFLSRTADRALLRGGPRAPLGRFYTPQNSLVLGVTTLPSPTMVESDGSDLWVTNESDTMVSRVRGGDGKLLQTWTGAAIPFAVVVALGKVFVTGYTAPGNLYEIDPRKPAGAVTTLASNLGDKPQGIAFDGTLLWTANTNGTVSRIRPATGSVVTTPGFASPKGVLYDGSNVWVSDNTAGSLLKLSGTGSVLQTVTLGGKPAYPAFDGTNIWVPNQQSPYWVQVVRASSGAVLATLTGNGLDNPNQAAFDGQRVLVTNQFSFAVSLWKAADLTEIGAFNTASGLGFKFPFGACSDGESFWITNSNANALLRF